MDNMKSTITERGDHWHPDPEKDKKLGGPGANQRAREDRADAAKPKSDSKKLRPGESYMDYAKRHGRKSPTPTKKKSLLSKLLRKEAYRVLAKDKGEEGKPSQFSYKDEKDAKKFADGIKGKGGKATITKEHHTKDKDGKVIEHEDTTPSSVEEEIKMTKKEYNKIHKDFKSDDPKNPRTTKYVPGKGTVSMPVKFVEGKGYQPEIEHSKLGDAAKAKKKKDDSKYPPHLRGDAIGKMKKAFAHTNEGRLERVAEGLKKARKNVGASTCWDGYKAQGTKKKGGKEVPNCVKEEEQELKEYSPNVSYQAKGGKKSGKLGKSSVYSLRGDDESKKDFRKSHVKDVKDGYVGKGHKPTPGKFKKEEALVVDEGIGDMAIKAIEKTNPPHISKRSEMMRKIKLNQLKSYLKKQDEKKKKAKS
tara:strand:- start:241 stop:1494 length:1254 start_codon:yes stop_codon:yes gene_type:complete